jgi:uncharacterized protein YabN with tetrapyrrole methylase and pyrophosphatase domain
LKDVQATRVTIHSTMFIPPRVVAPLDEQMMRRLAITPRHDRPRVARAARPSDSSAGGSVTVVGTGYHVAGQITPEAKALNELADQVFYLVSDPVTAEYIRGLNPQTTSLHDSYWDGRDGNEAGEEMVERVLDSVRQGKRVCMALYGHPAIFVEPSHEVVRRARSEGFDARMLPGISIADCLFADLGVDPGLRGCALYEATDFVLRRRAVNTAAPLILLQPGAVGTTHYHSRMEGDRTGLRVLVERLEEIYPPAHPVTLYEVARIPTLDTRIETVPLGDLEGARLTVYTTLFVPHLREPGRSTEMIERLGLASLMEPPPGGI